MLLGIDVGGTHTDAAVIDSSGVVSTFKAKTDKKNLLNSINEALYGVTSAIDRTKITNINLSTTLSTNAIIEDRIEKTGLFISAGPGINPQSYAIGDCTFIIDGSIDHRGNIVKSLNQEEIGKGIDECRKKGVKVFAAVSKFSTRNKEQEVEMTGLINDDSDFISMGHSLSGQLSFPRRVATAYYNSAVWRIYNDFTNSVEQSLADLGIKAPVNILKADGGTIPLNMSRQFPVESILSGPSASIMGIISLCDITEDSVILDIGGTTTDIAIFASGAPLIESSGVKLGGIPTLVRALQNKSIGIGGDSEIIVSGKKVTVGPVRRGPCMADGGDTAALVDALNYKGVISYGQKDKSIAGIKKLASNSRLFAGRIADEAIKYAVNKVKDEITNLILEINQKPVYTIHEMLEGKKIKPERIYLIGGPAGALAKAIAGNIKAIVPENYQVANAIGAALARTTIEAELFADTSTGRMVMPSLGIERKIEKKYSLREAEDDAASGLSGYLQAHGIDVNKDEIDIMQASSFRMIDSFYSSGDDIRVRCQIKPGVTMKLYR